MFNEFISALRTNMHLWREYKSEHNHIHGMIVILEMLDWNDVNVEND